MTVPTLATAGLDPERDGDAAGPAPADAGAPSASAATEKHWLQIANYAKAPLSLSLNEDWVGQRDDHITVPLEQLVQGGMPYCRARRRAGPWRSWPSRGERRSAASVDQRGLEGEAIRSVIQLRARGPAPRMCGCPQL
jgi:hypothetical protein